MVVIHMECSPSETLSKVVISENADDAAAARLKQLIGSRAFAAPQKADIAQCAHLSAFGQFFVQRLIADGPSYV